MTTPVSATSALEPITAQIAYSLEDFLRAPRFPRRIRPVVIIAWGCVYLFIVALALLVNMDDWKAQPTAGKLLNIAISAFILLAVFGGRWLISWARRRRRRHRALRLWCEAINRVQLVLSISNDGMTWNAQGQLRHFPWQHYVRFIENAQGFYVLTRTHHVVVIPKRAMEERLWEVVREYLRLHAARATGFPLVMDAWAAVPLDCGTTDVSP